MFEAGGAWSFDDVMLVALLLRYEPGQQVTLTIRRIDQGQEKQMKLHLTQQSTSGHL